MYSDDCLTFLFGFSFPVNALDGHDFLASCAVLIALVYIVSPLEIPDPFKIAAVALKYCDDLCLFNGGLLA